MNDSLAHAVPCSVDPGPFTMWKPGSGFLKCDFTGSRKLTAVPDSGFS